VLKLAGNLHHGFHEMFPPRDEPIKRHEEELKRREAKPLTCESDAPGHQAHTPNRPGANGLTRARGTNPADVMSQPHERMLPS